MRFLIVVAALGLSASAASAGPLTCWYNASGEFTGADGGSQGVPESSWGQSHAIPRPGGGSGDYAYLIVLPTYESGNDCPSNAQISAG